MIDWYRFRELLIFWLPPSLGVAICIFFMSLGWKLLSSTKREKEASRYLLEAYRYFKRLVEKDREGKGEE